MLKKNIIVVGYPKSGTTWTSRLVAELVQCPLEGDWGFGSSNALYKEGKDRDSEYRCFKSHHTFNAIAKASKSDIHKIIYVIRDPRDIAISGSHYFSFSPFYLTSIWKINLDRVTVAMRKLFNKLLSKKEKKRQMIRAVLYGKKSISYWLRTSWQEHYKDYLNRDILFVRYEELIDRPETECLKIMQYLKIKTNSKHIEESINKQSFKKRKLEDTVRNKDLKKLLRAGTYGYWEQELTKKEIFLFKQRLNTSTFYKF